MKKKRNRNIRIFHPLLDLYQNFYSTSINSWFLVDFKNGSVFFSKPFSMFMIVFLMLKKIFSRVLTLQGPMLVLVYPWYNNTQHNRSKDSKLVYLQEPLTFYTHNYIYIYIYIAEYCPPQTDCFVVLQHFSVARHVGRLKLESNPPNFTIDLVSLGSANKRSTSAQEL